MQHQLTQVEAQQLSEEEARIRETCQQKVSQALIRECSVDHVWSTPEAEMCMSALSCTSDGCMPVLHAMACAQALGRLGRES